MWSLYDSLRRRRRQPEVMDQPGLDEELHRGALRDLNRLHRFGGTAGRFWRQIRTTAGAERPLRILDLACGGGALAVDLARRARREGREVEVAGTDLSPLALAYARAEARRAGVDVRFFEHDAVAGEVPSCDVVVNSLFLHHLADGEAVGLLAKMAGSARRMVLCDDLIRSLRGWLYTYTGSRLIFRSPVVRVDGLLSVEAAFTPRELGGLADRAGLADVEIVTYWPQRQLLIWKRP